MPHRTNLLDVLCQLSYCIVHEPLVRFDEGHLSRNSKKDVTFNDMVNFSERIINFFEEHCSLLQKQIVFNFENFMSLVRNRDLITIYANSTSLILHL